MTITHLKFVLKQFVDFFDVSLFTVFVHYSHISDIEDKVNSQFLVRDKPLNMNPKLTGAPGMVIDLEDSETAPRKSGVELLKERFIYFSKLKSPEEIEREREKMYVHYYSF